MTVTFTWMNDLGASATNVFVDTGHLIALEDLDDANHSPARFHLESLKPAFRLTTTSYVLNAVVTFFNVRGRHGKAIELGETLLSSPSVTMIHVGQDLLRSGLALLRERPDKRYSLTDCISFVVMREHRIGTAFAFDRHFEQEGFIREPPRA